MNELILGVDIGTTGTKTIVVNPEGEILAIAYKGYPTYTLHNTWAEQDAMDWWDAVVATIRECIRDEEIRKNIVGIGLSSQGGSLVPVDDHGKPLRKSITWMDQRASAQYEELRKKNLDDYVYRTTGWKLGSGLNALQILWLRENEPDLFRRTYKFLSTIDFIAYKLTGEFAIDPSSAGITQLMNIHQKKWDSDIMDRVGIREDKLPLLMDSGNVIGKLSETAREELGLAENVIVVAGAHDQYCSATGAGVVGTEDILLATGSAWVVLGVSDSYKEEFHDHIAQSRHAAEEKWGTLVSMGPNGRVMEWFKDNLGKEVVNNDGSKYVEEFGQIDGKAAEKPPGANGLMFYPSFSGVYYIDKAKLNKGTILGLAFNHDRYDIARALMEGVAFDVRSVIEIFYPQTFKKGTLVMAGGAAQSILWPQIIADVMGVLINIPKVKHTSCLGAAIIAGKALKWFPTIIEGSRRLVSYIDTYEANPDNVEKYQQLFTQYKKQLKLITECYIN
ncbi:MAG: hypothetical protein GX094_04915 [Clostridiales bacterium]|nr:hypothetical protein [Clostridiales bacterium]